MPDHPVAAIVTIGNELVSGDVPNTNGAWLARRLERVGVGVRLIAAIPDDLAEIAGFLNAHRTIVDHLVVTGGLGGTPDDITREAIALTFGVGQEERLELTAELQARFTGAPEYVRRWAMLPVGSRPLRNPLGGAPGFVLENVWVFPGLPSEMEAMYESVEGKLAGSHPIRSWRRTFLTRESRIVGVLEAMDELHPGVAVGSYPSFHPHGSEVEIVLKSRDAEALSAASIWIERALDEETG